MTEKTITVYERPIEDRYKANIRRGRGADEIARQFVIDFPIPSELSAETFDGWLETHGVLSCPASDAPKDSDAWLAHLQRRHHAVTRLNKAGTHPRMNHGSTAFVLVVVAGKYIVKTPQEGIISKDIVGKVEHLVNSQRRQLRYLMESVDYAALPPAFRDRVEEMDDAINSFERGLNHKIEDLTYDTTRIITRIKRAIQSGEIAPHAHGLDQFLALSAPEEDND